MKIDLEEIIQSHIQTGNRNLAKEEIAELHVWLKDETNKKTYSELRRINKAVKSLHITIDTKRAYNKVSQRRSVRIPAFLQYAVIAIICISVGASIFYLTEINKSEREHIVATLKTQETHQPLLILGNGTSVPLTNNSAAIENESAITTANENYLEYNDNNTSTENSLVIPRGCIYQLVLSDGTKVWLNAESKITYPTAFRGKERRVYLEGEAYFEVKHNSEQPFIVSFADEEVKVLGTTFSIRNYKNDEISATLCSGSIQCSNSKEQRTLHPGEQMTVVHNRYEVKQVKTDETLAWVNDAFHFRERKLEYVLAEIARWYDLNIFYQKETLKDLHFTAWFRRSCSVDEIIKLMEDTNLIRLNRQGKTLIVMPK